MKIIVLLVMVSSSAFAQEYVKGGALDEMKIKYGSESTGEFSASKGEAMWNKEVVSEDGTSRSCATCHNADITTSGKHKKTGKIIAPMALSATFEKIEEKDIPRYSKAKKIKKWFKRNCKWTYGRECTAQEKGDFLSFFQSK